MTNVDFCFFPLHQTVMFSENDPLRCSKEEMSIGYNFTLKTQPTKAISQKRKPATKDQIAAVMTAKPSKKNPLSSMDASLTSKSTGGQTASASTKVERKRKGTGQSAPRTLWRQSSLWLSRLVMLCNNQRLVQTCLPTEARIITHRRCQLLDSSRIHIINS